MRLDDFLSRLTGVHKNGKGWEALCPGHDDHHPSLGIDEAEGKILVVCRSRHCAPDAIVSALGLRMSDLFVEALPPLPKSAPSQPRRIVTTYDYRDEAGELLYQTVRFEPKDFSQRRPDGHGDWVWSLKDARRVPYRLPELRAANASRWVLFPEGEKDAETLREWNFVATTVVGGTGGWQKFKGDYLDHFRGRNVAVPADNDLPGLTLAREKANDLLGIAARVRLIELPVEGVGEDVTDWRDRYGGTRQGFIDLVNATPDYSAEPAPAPDPYAGWEQPLELVEPNLPAFPYDSLPMWLSDFCQAVAVSRQVPVDLPCLVGLAMLATACAKRVKVQMRAGWIEPVNLYTVCALPPAGRKSSVFADLARPAKLYAERRRRQDEKRVAQLEMEYEIAKARANEAKMKAAKATSVSQRDMYTEMARDLAVALLDQPRPHRFQLTVDDATPERLGSILAEQGGRIAMFSTEGGVFDLIAGRYSNGVPNLDLYLKAHPGDTWESDRIGRGHEAVLEPALTIALVVQPEVIRGLASKRVFRGKGLLGRFLYAVPESTVGHRQIEGPPIPCSFEEAYTDNLSRLLDLRPEVIGDEEHAHILSLDEDAHRLRRELEEWIEPRLAEFGEFGHISDWAGKLAGHVGRIAGLLHMGQYTRMDRPWEIPISGDVFARAIDIGKYLIPHAKRAFGEMGSDPVLRGSQLIIRWIDKTGCAEFTQRDLHRSLQGSVPKSAHLTQPLWLLEERGYVRRREDRRFYGSGQNPSPTFEVNPIFLHKLLGKH